MTIIKRWRRVNVLNLRGKIYSSCLTIWLYDEHLRQQDVSFQRNISRICLKTLLLHCVNSFSHTIHNVHSVGHRVHRESAKRQLAINSQNESKMTVHNPWRTRFRMELYPILMVITGFLLNHHWYTSCAFSHARLIYEKLKNKEKKICMPVMDSTVFKAGWWWSSFSAC